MYINIRNAEETRGLRARHFRTLSFSLSHTYYTSYSGELFLSFLYYIMLCISVDSDISTLSNVCVCLLAFLLRDCCAMMRESMTVPRIFCFGRMLFDCILLFTLALFVRCCLFDYLGCVHIYIEYYMIHVEWYKIPAV